jgi:hypothetical protein
LSMFFCKRLKLSFCRIKFLEHVLLSVERPISTSQEDGQRNGGVS